MESKDNKKAEVVEVDKVEKVAAENNPQDDDGFTLVDRIVEDETASDLGSESSHLS